MKIGLRGGHSPNCKGAIGLRDEYQCMQVLYRYVKTCLESWGHTVIDCNSNGWDESQELAHGVNVANSNNVDLFISLHMNSYFGKGYGTECWTHSPSSRAEEKAKRICKNLSSLGWYNRGVKHDSSMYEMRKTDAPNIIVEVCFCDSEKDIAIWSPTSYEDMALAISSGIDPNITSYEKRQYYQVRYYKFGSYEQVLNFQTSVKSLVGDYYSTIEKI